MPKHVSKTSQTGKKKGKVLSAAMRQKAKEEEEAKDRLRAEKKAARAAKREAKATEKTAKKGSMKEVKEKEAKERMGKTEDQEDSASVDAEIESDLQKSQLADLIKRFEESYESELSLLATNATDAEQVALHQAALDALRKEREEMGQEMWRLQRE